MNIFIISGTRPNFVKAAALYRALRQNSAIRLKIIHTGQHYDERMSDIFFEQLRLPAPDYYLGVGGGSHTQQTAHIMLAFENVVLKERPDLVLVVGDVNSTLACALVAAKEGIPLVHVEAGLRSGDRSMPEEINRVVTDALSDMLFVSEQSGLDHLAREGLSQEKIFFVGNVMIDSLLRFQDDINQSTVLKENGLSEHEYALITLHRPSNVDTADGLEKISQVLINTANRLKVVFPVHPRTLNNLARSGQLRAILQHPQILLTEPLGYFDFLKLVKNARLVLTDSGGIQEETTFLRIPCLTLRDNTERPVTLSLGTNRLLERLNPSEVDEVLKEVLRGPTKERSIPPLWDGKASDRIAALIWAKYRK
jgi:UDP-N-acetylglucosamine 2-epimerase (non-hydrolysing)